MNIEFFKSNHKKILFVLGASFGEFDNLIPISIKIMKTSPGTKIKILYLNKEQYLKALKDKLIKKFLDKYNIDMIKPSGFNILYIVPYLVVSSNLIIVTENIAKHFQIIFYFFKITLKKNIILFRHSGAPEFSAQPFITRYEFFRKRFGIISITKEDMILKKKMKYNNNYYSNITYNYIDYLKLGNFFSKKDKFITIFSYRSNEKFFSFWNKLKTYSVILEVIKKKFGNIKIFIKLHPSENRNEVKKIMSILNFSKYEIEDTNSIILVKNCILAFSLNNNGGLFSYYNHVPTLNYIDYISLKKFYRYRRKTLEQKIYSQQVLAGIPTAINKSGILKIINQFEKKSKINAIIKIFS